MPRILIHFGSILILNHWRGSPAVGEWCGKVLQIKEMIALNIVSLRILYSLWHYRDSNIPYSVLFAKQKFFAEKVKIKIRRI